MCHSSSFPTVAPTSSGSGLHSPGRRTWLWIATVAFCPALYHSVAITPAFLSSAIPLPFRAPSRGVRRSKPVETSLPALSLPLAASWRTDKSSLFLHNLSESSFVFLLSSALRRFCIPSFPGAAPQPDSYWPHRSPQPPPSHRTHPRVAR